MRIGATLRAAREKKGLSVNAVADMIKFTPELIEQLESDNFHEQLESQTTYVRGYIRNYARAVDLNPEQLLEVLPKVEATPIQPAEEISSPFEERNFLERSSNFWTWVVALLAIVVVLFGGWHLFKNLKSSEGQPDGMMEIDAPVMLPDDAELIDNNSAVSNAVILSDQPAEPVAAETTESSGASAAAKNVMALLNESDAAPDQAGSASSETDRAVRFVFDGDSWVEIKDRNGKVLSSKVNAAGSELEITGKRPLSLVVGNARQVQLYDGDREIPLQPPAGGNVVRMKLN